jgi:RNA polymerase sigma factor (sigma-70 family)
MTAAAAFATYGKQVAAFIQKRVASAEDAEDILSEVFYQLSRMDSLAKPVEQVGAWLYRVARNHIINWYAKKKDTPLPLDTEAGDDDDMLADISDFLFSTDSSPETEYLRSLVLAEIDTALADLPPEQRAIFEQTEVLGLPVKEIARITGTPANTLRSRKHYAVLRLRKSLRSLYDEMTGCAGPVRSTTGVAIVTAPSSNSPSGPGT